MRSALRTPHGRRPALDAFLAALGDKLLATAQAVDRSHFVHLAPQWSLVGPAGSVADGDGSAQR